MSHEAGKTEQGDSFAATNGHPKSPSNDAGGSITPSEVDNARAPSAASEAAEPAPHGEVEVAAEGYDIGTAGQPQGDPSPRHTDFAPETTTRRRHPSKHRTRELTGPLEPPVTKATLGELDVNKIVQSPKLRHDINFDPALHFRPNVEGDKGRRKRQKAAEFWSIMRKQLQEYLANREEFEKEADGEDWTLPMTLKAIREILETLVPQRDRSSVQDTFNVDLLMQQFRKGVADLVRLATWLSQLIKCHCAPMRDLWVDDMVNQITRGSEEGDVAQLTGGIATLLGILEAMKLDVANHQIRCLRPMLIEDTVHFERKFFMRKIASGDMDLYTAHAWFTSAANLPDVDHLEAATPQLASTWQFMKGLVNLSLPSHPAEPRPHTFCFDDDRIAKLRADIEDLVNLEICMRRFGELETARKRQRALAAQYNDTPGTSFVSSPFGRATSPDNSALHSSPTLPLPHHFTSKPKSSSTLINNESSQTSSNSEEWSSNLETDPIALSSATSPRSARSSASSTPGTFSPLPLYLSQHLPDSASQVRSSLQAIIDPAMTTERWTELASSLALQILRSTTTPLSHLPAFEADLESHLSNPQSKIYQDAEQRILAQLMPTLRGLIETYTPLTCLQIFELAAVPKGPTGLPGQQLSSKDEITGIATRLAHIGIIHWRVWAPLAYLTHPDAPEAVSEEDQPMTGTSPEA